MKRLLFFLLAFVLVTAPSYAQKRELGKVKTLVIDPGHGGAKPGAHGKTIVEKELTLAVALKFGKLVEKHFPDVTVIYTRTTDVDIALYERTAIANKAKADLFISIHANAHPTEKPSGVETFVMGLSQSKANLEVAKKENADILLESDYESNSAYEGFDPNSPESYVMFSMFQNAYLTKSLDFAGFIQKQYSGNLKTIDRGVKQAELFVIYRTAMPAVLTEIGFMTNPAEEAVLLSDAGRNAIALCLYNAFAAYKANEEGTQPLLLATYDGDVKQDVAAKPASAADAKAARERAAKEQAAREQAEKDMAAAREHAAREAAEREARAEADAQAQVAAQIAQQQAAARAEQQADEPAPQPSAVQETAEPPAVAQETVDSPSIANAPVPPAPLYEPAEESSAFEPPSPAPKSKVVFKVQFLQSDKPIKSGDKQLKGLDHCDYYMKGSTYCYTWGSTSSMEAAKALQSDVRAKGFKDAFVVAFADGERISIQRARELMGE